MGIPVTWEGYVDENVPFGDVTVVIEGDGSATISHETRIKMSYSGFMCDSRNLTTMPSLIRRFGEVSARTGKSANVPFQFSHTVQ